VFCWRVSWTETKEKIDVAVVVVVDWCDTSDGTCCAGMIALLLLLVAVVGVVELTQRKKRKMKR